MIRKKLFAILISIALLAMLISCADEQPDVVLFTPEADDPAEEAQPQDESMADAPAEAASGGGRVRHWTGRGG